jgi:uncharacterized protein (DUF1684 family)
VPGTQTSVGDVVFTLPGDPREHRLRASQDETGALAITFHDATNGTSTASWRKVSLRRPRPDGSVVLDLNRTINYPSAFTPYGTCPRPVAANVVDAPIEGGEKRPRPRCTGQGPGASGLRFGVDAPCLGASVAVGHPVRGVDLGQDVGQRQ